MRWMTCYWFDYDVHVEDAVPTTFSLRWFPSLEIFLGMRCHLCGVARQHALLCDFGPSSLSIEFETQEEPAMFYVCPLIHFYTRDVCDTYWGLIPIFVFKSIFLPYVDVLMG
jgi:hypothetical protein